MRISGLDLAGTVGWASGASDGDPEYGEYRLPQAVFVKKDGKKRKTTTILGPYLKAYHFWFLDHLDTYHPDYVAFERPFSAQNAADRPLHCLCGHTEFVCEIRGIECGEISSAQMKMFMTGKGDASKKMKPYPVTRACQAYGWDPQSTDAADGLGVWALAVSRLAPRDWAKAFDKQGALL